MLCCQKYPFARRSVNTLNTQQIVSVIDLQHSSKMSRATPLICLYIDSVPDIQQAIESARKVSYDRIISRLTCPQLAHRVGNKDKNKIEAFTRSDLLLSGEQWRQNTILKVGEIGDCDSSNKHVRKSAIQKLKQEISWAKHLDSIACIVVVLNSDESFNVARQLLEKFDQTGCVLTEVPIIDKSYFTQNYCKNRRDANMIELKSVASATVWKRWNRFRLSTEFSGRIKVSYI